MIGRAGSGTEVTARLLIYCQLYLVIKTSYLLLEPQFAVILSEGSGQLLNHEPVYSDQAEQYLSIRLQIDLPRLIIKFQIL